MVDEEETLKVPTESIEPEPKRPRGRPKKDAPVFARPVFSNELLTDEARQKFDQLPAWQRHLVKRVIEHGDLKRAANEAGVGTQVSTAIDIRSAEQKDIIQTLNHQGLTNDYLVTHLMECLEAKTMRFDKHGNAISCVDLNTKLKTIEVICRLKGLFESKKQDKVKSDDELFNDTPV